MQTSRFRRIALLAALSACLTIAAAECWRPLVVAADGARPGVLFLCTGNSARSQMAEGLMRHYAGDRFTIYSAGTHPKPVINPLAVRAMKEIGIDLSGQRPKDMQQFLDKIAVEHLIVVCSNAQDTCPANWPGVSTRAFWNLPDPAAAKGTDNERLEVFRRSRDEIGRRIREWLAKQGVDAPEAASR